MPRFATILFFVAL